jgi:hypothetical protein
MSKTHKKRAAPQIPPGTILRARLDGLWQNPALGTQPLAQIEADLDAVARGVRPDQLCLTLLRAYQAAPAETHARVDEVLPGWLQRRSHLPVLEALATGSALESALREVALRWLAVAGRDVSAVWTAPSDSFCAAYDLDDGSQAAVILLWYTHPRRDRASGMSFLIDYNPPWDGAVKDIMVFPHKSPQALTRRFVDIWEERGRAMAPIGAAEFKRKVLTALGRNRTQDIRLPHDLIAARDLFLRYVLTLPDLPDTPAFTAADFDALAGTGQTPESLSHFEHTVGRRIRMDDGKEVFIDAAIANMEFDDWDESPER